MPGDKPTKLSEFPTNCCFVQGTFKGEPVVHVRWYNLDACLNKSDFDSFVSRVEKAHMDLCARVAEGSSEKSTSTTLTKGSGRTYAPVAGKF